MKTKKKDRKKNAVRAKLYATEKKQSKKKEGANRDWEGGRQNEKGAHRYGPSAVKENETGSGQSVSNPAVLLSEDELPELEEGTGTVQLNRPQRLRGNPQDEADL